MGLVLDTNIVVRFVYSPRGFIVGLIRVLQPPAHDLITSPALLHEAVDVLGRPRLLARQQMDDQGIQTALDHLYAGFPAPVTLPATATTIVPHDPKDDAVVLTAIAGDADVICTLGSHLHEPDVKAFCSQHASAF